MQVVVDLLSDNVTAWWDDETHCDGGHCFVCGEAKAEYHLRFERKAIWKDVAEYYDLKKIHEPEYAVLAEEHGRAAAGRAALGCRGGTVTNIGRVISGFAVLLAVGCQRDVPEVRPVSPKETPPSADFVSITEGSKLDVSYQNGREAGLYAIPESLGGGCAIVDYDHDGQLDIFTPGGGGFVNGSRMVGRDSALSRGQPGLVFQSAGDLAGCAKSSYYSHGCAVADADNDGFDDILLTGFGGLQFFHNMGDGTFLEVASSWQLQDRQWSSSAGWADLDADGNLDLYICHYVDWTMQNNPVCVGGGPDHRDVCPPREFEGLRDTLYFNNGDGTFRDGSDSAGLVEGGKGLGVILADFDHDKDSDIYVANDTTPNFFYQNDGEGNFREIGVINGTALDERGTPNGSMGTATGDFDNDGLTDLWVTNFEMETFGLYRNRGECQFLHISRDSGVNAIGSRFVGFGTVTEDFDLDGDVDIVVANGHVNYYPPEGSAQQTPVYLENQGQGLFKSVCPETGRQYFHSGHVGRGVAVGDFNKDGKPDLIFSHLDTHADLLINNSVSSGRAIRVSLIGTTSNRNGIGARVVLSTSAGFQIRHVAGGGSYLSQSEIVVTFGVAPGVEPRLLTVIWPSEEISEQIIPLAHETTVTLKEPL